MNYSLNAVGV